MKSSVGLEHLATNTRGLGFLSYSPGAFGVIRMRLVTLVVSPHGGADAGKHNDSNSYPNIHLATDEELLRCHLSLKVKPI